MATIIVKNNSGSVVSIDDLGITLANATQRTLVQDDAGEFTIDELDGSVNLYTLVAAGTLILNDGTTDLSTVNGVRHVKLDTEWEIDGSYSVSGGGGTVHWDNITDAPPAASPNWKEPVLCRVEERSPSGPIGPDDGMFYLDTDDGHLYKRVASAWVDQGAPSEPDAFIDKTDEEVYHYNDSSSTWSIQVGPDESDARIVADDGDGGAAAYVYNGSAWIKLSDVDWGDHGALSGLDDDDHTQYHNDTRGDVRYHLKTYFYDTSQGTQTGIVADSTGKIDVSFLPTIVSDHGDLTGLGDDDHTQYLNNARGDIRYYQQSQFYNTSQGNATGIFADSTGKLDVSFLPDSALLSDHGALTGLGDDDHTQYHTDTRGDARYYTQSSFFGTSQSSQTPILSDATGKIDISYLPDMAVNSMATTFGRGKAKLKTQWLRGAGDVLSNLSGTRMALAAQIIGMSVQVNGTGTATFYVRRNGSTTNLTNLALAGTAGAQTYALAIDLAVGDFLGVYMDVTSGNVDYPVVTVWYIWS